MASNKTFAGNTALLPGEKKSTETVPPSPRFRSRRRPLLHVFGESNLPPKHAVSMPADTWYVQRDFVIEVFLLDEWESLPEGMRPDRAKMMPGIGWLVVREPTNAFESADLEDMREQAVYAWEHRFDQD